MICWCIVLCEHEYVYEHEYEYENEYEYDLIHDPHITETQGPWARLCEQGKIGA